MSTERKKRNARVVKALKAGAKVTTISGWWADTQMGTLLKDLPKQRGAVKWINPKYLIAALRALPKGCTVSVSRVSQDIDVYDDVGGYFGWLESTRDGEVVFKAAERGART